ncbi:TfoX/Sxy family protein [Niveibacterium sp. SC-1]|uniref:TfoX/Sxy family protein n=1 Tax=Niveibacterium sp. SC-1 TaxID=3135646 RepID=UPI00311E8337
MSASPEFVSHVRDLLSPLGPLTDGKFFGGHAMKYEGKQFAMVMGNILYFRVNEATRSEYEKRGSTSFSYSTKRGVVQVRTYYSAPEELFENTELLLSWAKKAIKVAATA